MVLGLNDALVELTGTLAGLTFALKNTRLIALSGLITGIAATLSMAASEYLSARTEQESSRALKSSVYAKHGQRFIAEFFAEEEQSNATSFFSSSLCCQGSRKKALNTPSILFKHIVISSPAREAKIVGQEIQGRVWVSISHEKDNAVAIAIWEAD